MATFGLNKPIILFCRHACAVLGRLFHRMVTSNEMIRRCHVALLSSSRAFSTLSSVKQELQSLHISWLRSHNCEASQNNHHAWRCVPCTRQEHRSFLDQWRVASSSDVDEIKFSDGQVTTTRLVDGREAPLFHMSSLQQVMRRWEGSATNTATTNQSVQIPATTR